METERLVLRKMQASDFADLCLMLRDADVMAAYEGAFTEDEAHEWLDKQQSRYQTDGLGLLAVTLKGNGKMIGQCGLTWQKWKEQTLLEIGYLFQKAYWRQGYAIEAARACKAYAFDTLHADAVCSIIRDTNIASQNVALRNGMSCVDSYVKHYRGVDMPHFLYMAARTRGSESEKSEKSEKWKQNFGL